jgi:hypothetical protein
MKDIKIQTLASPLLGVGQQELDPEVVIRTLLDLSKTYLNRSQYLKRVILVAHHQEKVSQLDEAMNKALERVRIALPKGELVEGVRKEILKCIDNLTSLAPGVKLLIDARRIIS